MFRSEIIIREERDISLGGVEESAFSGVTLSDEFIDRTFQRINGIGHAGSLAVAPPIETAQQPPAEAEALSLAAA